MIEMAALANTTGLEVSKRGMHGAAVHACRRCTRPSRSQEDGGILDRPA